MARGTSPAQDDTLITQEIHYHMPDAGQVILIWGIDAWTPVPEDIRPANTVVADGVMHTPMARNGDTFVIKLQVPAGATIDYGFMITEALDGTEVHVWEGQHDPLASIQDGATEVETALTLVEGQATVRIDRSQLVSQEIRLGLPQAGEVFLAWGGNGWFQLPEEVWPDGTWVRDGLMHTPMHREKDTFVARVLVPADMTIDYIFRVTQSRTGVKTEFEENNGGQGYHTLVTDGKTVEVGFVIQQIRYYLPEAGAVSLVWGIDGWTAVSEGIRPAGTVVKDSLMHTPMVREGNTFVAKVQVPNGATIDYVFLTTQTRDGAEIEVWDQDCHTVARPGGVTGVKATVTLGEPKSWASGRDVGLYLVISIASLIIAGIVLGVVRLDQSRTVAVALIGLTLVGLAFRLWAAWDAGRYLTATAARVSGPGTSLEELEDPLSRDPSLVNQGHAPLYAGFLAACDLILGPRDAMVRYVQAVVGSTVIPLTWLLARRFTGEKASLLTAAVIALHPALAARTTTLTSENLTPPLLLVTLLALAWALEDPLPERLALAGLPLAIANLCHPAGILFPALLPLFLPRAWDRRDRAIGCAAYASLTVLFVALWTLFGYLGTRTSSPLSALATSLWQGSPEFFDLMESKQSISQIQHEQLNPALNGGYDPFTTAGAQHFIGRALNSVAAEPGAYVVYFLLKPAFFWIGHPAIDWPQYAMFSVEALLPYYSTLRVAGVLWAVFLPLVTLAVLAAANVTHGPHPYLAPLLIICGYFMLIHALGYPELRFSEPLHPILATIIAATLHPREFPPRRIPARGARFWRHV